LVVEKMTRKKFFLRKNKLLLFALKKKSLEKELNFARAIDRSPFKQLGKDEALKEFFDGLDVKITTHKSRPTEESVWATKQMEVAEKLKKDYDMELAELIILPLTEKENILKAIQAGSAWSAFLTCKRFLIWRTS